MRSEMEANVRRATKKKVTKKKVAKKKVSRRRKVVRLRSKNERIFEVAEVADEQIEGILSQHAEIKELMEGLRISIEDAESVGFALREIAKSQDDGTGSRGVPRDEVLKLLRAILNLDEEDELVTVDGIYVPLKHPRVPLSTLHGIALDLYRGMHD